MIYPNNYEQKIGFNEVRGLLSGHCQSSLGKELVENTCFSYDADIVNEELEQTREMRRIQEEGDFPLTNFFDVRESVSHIRLEGTHLEEEELWYLRQSLEAISKIVDYLGASRSNSSESSSISEDSEDAQTEEQIPYPALNRLASQVVTFPRIIQQVDQILDKFGHMRDTASPELHRIRRELALSEGSISKTLYGILRSAQGEGLVERDVTPTMRDGRLVIPVAPAMKRRIGGIVHDESASGRTVFIEPTEVVEANNKIRELEADERREKIRILTEVSKQIRPYVKDILESFKLLAQIDFIRAKAEFANQTKAIEPPVSDCPLIDWIQAKHPLLQKSLEAQGKVVIPLDIFLTEEKRILIISGPNAGGKSVCLKTVGLLQYMLQCGISIPVSERSKVGVFDDIMIDIGDEQSLENDLSTYSSHLMNMKQMMKQACERTLLLIDEFGTGTEPQIGGAISEAVLQQFCNKGAYGVITTHYQNLKHFADTHDGIANGAMLYDRKEMQPLFMLSIGQPGSSFAIEIARKIGLPEDVIKEASDIVGSDYIQSDKYLQDIVRDKRYWEGKRQTIHQREKDLEKTIARYESNLTDIESQRKEILRQAHQQAEELLNESNKRIENAIRDIRESQANKEETKLIRENLKQFADGNKEEKAKGSNGLMGEDELAKKIEQMKQRRLRHEQRQKEKLNQSNVKTKKETSKKSKDNEPLKVGDTVHIKGLTTIGTIEEIDGKMASVIFGDMRTKMRAERLVKATEQPVALSTMEKRIQESNKLSKITRDTIDERRKNFHQDLDVRGMRGNEALSAVQYFIDDAILVGMSRVRILHGKGNGILSQLIREYLSGIPNVTHYADEQVQFGGAGITVVDLG
jgi:DNA mismatch repair protein MutS2